MKNKFTAISEIGEFNLIDRLTQNIETKHASTKKGIGDDGAIITQLAKKMGWKKILVLTFKPAVQNAWEQDLITHVDFKVWQFFSSNNSNF